MIRWLSLSITLGTTTQTGQKLEGRNWGISHERMLLGALLLIAWPACFLTAARVTSSGMALPTVVWVLLHKLLVKTRPYWATYSTILWRHFSQSIVPLPRWLYLVSNQHKTSQKRQKKQFLWIMIKRQIALISDKINVSTNIMSQMMTLYNHKIFIHKEVIIGMYIRN